MTSISLLATQPRLFELNTICMGFELRLRNLCVFHLKPASFKLVLTQEIYSYVLSKVQGLVKMILDVLFFKEIELRTELRGEGV